MARNKLSTESYKGVRDFYPEDQALERYLFDTMRKTAESFGYVEYGASILEPAELYVSKTSEEIVSEQTYTFTDRGGREVTLRPEMTPTLARMVAAKRRELAFPLRWYSIPNIFRYERPQRGRLREHWQLNCDLFGVAGPEAEAEIITLAYRLMKNFGAADTDFEIHLNSRVALNTLFRGYGLTEAQTKKLRLLVDKKDKMPATDFDAAAMDIVGKPFVLRALEDKNLDALTSMLETVGITNVKRDPTLVRGFDYYTGMVFEVFDASPKNNRSLFGGGRYDNLLELFGSDTIPAVGFGMGDVTTRDFLEIHGLLPELPSTTNLAICTVEPSAIPGAQAIAHELRKLGVNVVVNVTDKKVGDQIKTADKQNIPYIICIGEKEMSSRRYVLKNLKSGAERELGIEEIPAIIGRR